MTGYWSTGNGTRMRYWPGGLGRDNMCGCGITKSCDEPRANCNCDIVDGNTRKDMGLITVKENLPVGSLTFNAIGGDKKGRYVVGWVQCAPEHFGKMLVCKPSSMLQNIAFYLL